MKRRGIILAIILLAVGFAAVSTTLIINGRASIVADQNNFDIYFSEAVLDSVDSPQLISEDRKTITYTTKDLKVAGESSVLDYVVTNNSTQYDAEVEINCTPSSTEYLTITNKMDADIIKASTSEVGTLTVRLNQNTTEEIETEFTCTIVANAIEREETGGSVSSDSLYSFISNNVGNYGITLLSETESDKYPIYYYTSPENNYVLFANFCWRIVRTTDTGGVKLLYNGEPDENGNCYNFDSDTAIGTSSFNDSSSSLADVGYMYNIRYETYNIRYETSTTFDSETLYGNSFTYDSDTDTYTLVDTKSIADWKREYYTLNNYHYTCFDESGTCTGEIYYVYSGTDNGNACYIILNDGKTVEEALEEMLSAEDVNTYDSTVKTIIDSWYEENMLTYTSYLEDTVWCNDRSISNLSGWNPNGGSIVQNSSLTNNLQFNSYSNVINLNCPRKIDSFTVNESEKGNGALTYPVGMLTKQEALIIGHTVRHIGWHYWLLSPFDFALRPDKFFNVYTSAARNSRINPQGDVIGDNVTSVAGVRPVISLKRGIEYLSGDGSENSPFVIG